MKNIKQYPKIFIKKNDKNTPKLVNVTESSWSIFFEEEYVLSLSWWASKKQLDLVLFRWKDKIHTYKYNGKKYISINILLFIEKNFRRLLNKSK